MITLDHHVALQIAMKMKGRQGKEEYKLTARGTIHEKGDTTYVRFEEKLDEIGTVQQLIKIAMDELIIHRKGQVSMRQQFLIGKETHGVYETPFGRLPFVIKTNRWHYNWDNDLKRGELNVDYEMTIEGNEKQKHKLSIKMRKAGNDYE